jgi:hypothetical protein
MTAIWPTSDAASDLNLHDLFNLSRGFGDEFPAIVCPRFKNNSGHTNEHVDAIILENDPAFLVAGLPLGECIGHVDHGDEWLADL